MENEEDGSEIIVSGGVQFYCLQKLSMFLWSGDLRFFSIFIVTYKNFQTLQTETIICQDFIHCSKILAARNGVKIAVLVRISVNIHFPVCRVRKCITLCTAARGMTAQRASKGQYFKLS
jgi:hypothetical protein